MTKEELEKEAERYAEKNETRGGGSSFGDETNYHDLRQAFKDGAEFAYNKCIAVLKCECRRCVYTDSPCILSDYGKDKNGLCDHFKDVFDEIAELKEINAHTISHLNLDNGELIIENEKLREENAEARDIIEDLITKIPASLVDYFESEKERAEKFLGWK